MKKVITLTLIIVMTAMLFLGCAEESAGETQTVVETQPVSAFNSTLVDAIGEEWLSSNKATIDQLVADLENANKAYHSSGDLKVYCDTVDKILKDNENFRAELASKLDVARNEDSTYFRLYMSASSWTVAASVSKYSMAAFGTEVTAEDEANIKEELISESNQIAQLLLGKDIAS